MTEVDRTEMGRIESNRTEMGQPASGQSGLSVPFGTLINRDNILAILNALRTDMEKLASEISSNNSASLQALADAESTLSDVRNVFKKKKKGGR